MKKVLPVFLWNKGQSSSRAEIPQLHSTASSVLGFTHPSKALMHTMIAFAQKEGLHSPHSSLVSTLLEDGEKEAGEEAGKKEREREKDNFNVKDR